MIITEEKLREIASLAKRCRATDRTRMPDEDISGCGVVEPPDPLSGLLTGQEVTEMIIDSFKVPSLPEEKLRKALSSLTREEMCELEAVMWLGRQTYPDGDIDDADEQYGLLYQNAQNLYEYEKEVEYVFCKYPVLSKYILRGMLVMSMAEKS